MNNNDKNKVVNNSIEEHIAQEVKQREAAEKGTAFVRELFFLILLVILSVILVIMSLQLFLRKPQANGPGTYPLFASGAMLLCCLAATIQLIGKHRKNEDGNASMKSLKLSLVTEIPFTVFVMIVATTVYVVGISLIGFYIPTAVYMFFSTFFLFEGKKEKFMQSLLVGAGTALAVWLIIEKIFQIRMP